MKRSKFSEEQVTYALRQHEAGTPAADICRQLGVSEATFYVWKKKYVHMGVAELRELHQLREENARLKRVVADLTLDKHILTDVVKKALRPARRRELVGWIAAQYAISVLRACELAQFSRLPWRGHALIHVLLRREGWIVNHKRVRRLYRLEGLQLRMRMRRRKHMCLHRGVVPKAVGPMERLSMDFVHDELFDGRRMRILTVVDQWNREAVVVEPAYGFSGQAVVEVLDMYLESHQVPTSITAPSSPPRRWKPGLGNGV